MNARIDLPAYSGPTKPAMTGFAVTSLVLGIVGVVLSPVPILNNLSIAGAVVGLVLGLIAVVRSGRWMAVFGFGLSLAGIIIALVMQARWSQEMDELKNDLNGTGVSAPTPVEDFSDTASPNGTGEDVYLMTLDMESELADIDDGTAIDLGYAICDFMATGASSVDAATNVLDSSGGFSAYHSGYIVGAATGALCPEYAGR